MFAERNVRRDLIALCLMVLAIFLGLALLTYDPADPVVELVYPLNQIYEPDVVVYPRNVEATNHCGPWGALIACLLLETIGVGAYLAVGTLAAVSLLLIAQQDLDSIVFRTIGWSLALIGFCTLAQMLVPSWTSGPAIGAGGYLGTLGAGLLKMHFALAGGLVLAISVLAAGLLLCTDYVLVHIGLMLGTMTLLTMARSGSRLVPKRSWRSTSVRRNNVDDVAVRIRGKRVDSAQTRLSPTDRRTEDPSMSDESLPSADAPSLRVVHESDLAGDHHDVHELDDECPAEDAASSDEVPDESPATSLLRATRGRRRLGLFARRPAQPSEDREVVMQQLDEASETEDELEYSLPSIDLLQQADSFSVDDQAKEVQRKAKILEKTFASFGLNVKVVEIETGPVIAQYEVALEAGLRLSKITGLADDLAIALRVPSVRIVAPIPGKNTVGIEVPNEERQLVRLREVMEESTQQIKKMRIPIFLGKDVSGNPLTVDLSAMPHLLIAGRTGTGKSVCLNAIIASILMTRRPDEVRMLMIDPKMVELSGYKSLPHLMHPVVTDMRKAEAILAWAVDKMEERYALLARAGVRHISSYNQLSEEEIMERVAPETDEERQSIPLHMPFIVIVADEMADLMMTSGKEVEQHIIRLAQKSRAVGIHLILATQKPTVDVITGLIKSNLPARIAFQVSSRTDSRVVLDEMGADKLLGNGDMLFLWPGTSTLIRGQGTYLSDDEINAVVQCVSTGEQDFVNELVHLKVENREEGNSPKALKQRDELYEDAIEVVIREGRGSVSLLQRALGIGYGRAARLIDFMAEDGIVGTYAGSQAREVLMTLADWERMKAGDAEADGSHGGSRTTDNDKSGPIARSSTDSRLSNGNHLRLHSRHHTNSISSDDCDETADDELIQNAYDEEEFPDDEFSVEAELDDDSETEDCEEDDFEEDDFDSDAFDDDGDEVPLRGNGNRISNRR